MSVGRFGAVLDAAVVVCVLVITAVVSATVIVAIVGAAAIAAFAVVGVAAGATIGRGAQATVATAAVGHFFVDASIASPPRNAWAVASGGKVQAVRLPHFVELAVDCIPVGYACPGSSATGKGQHGEGHATVK